MNTDTTNPKDRMGATKPQLHLTPPALKIHTAKAMEYGAFKAGPQHAGYGPYNWRKTKVRLTVYISAIERHLSALLDGEDFASDSGVHHAAHIAASCGIILDALECACLIDDRPPKGCAAALISRMTESQAPATPEPADKQYIELKREYCPECKFISIEGKRPYHHETCPLRRMSENDWAAKQKTNFSKCPQCGRDFTPQGICRHCKET